jgi:hypothetical protein
MGVERVVAEVLEEADNPVAGLAGVAAVRDTRTAVAVAVAVAVAEVSEVADNPVAGLA